MKKPFCLFLMLFYGSLFAASPSFQQMTNYANPNVLLITNSSYILGPATNFNSFSNINGASAFAIMARTNYAYAGLISGLPYWTNFNTLSCVISNGCTVDGTNFWCYTTNNGVVPGANTNLIWFYHTVPDPQGYPSNGVQWIKRTTGVAAGIPNNGIRFATTNSQQYPTGILASAFQFRGPIESNSVTAFLDTQGSDTLGRVGGYPFRTLDQVNLANTNGVSIVRIGPGVFVNSTDLTNNVFGTTTPYTPRSILPSGQVIIGSGQGVTTLGQAPPVNQTDPSIWLGNSNTISSLNLPGVFRAPAGVIITNLTINDSTLGGPTNIDCAYASSNGEGIYDANLSRCALITTYDSTAGMTVAAFTNCDFYGIALTNNPILAPSSAMRLVRLTGGPENGNGTNRFTLVSCNLFANGAYTNNVNGAQAIFSFSTTNSFLTLQNCYIEHESVLSVFGFDVGTFNSHINGNYRDVSKLGSNVLSVFDCIVSNGVISTNFGGIDIGLKANTNAPVIQNMIHNGTATFNTNTTSSPANIAASFGGGGITNVATINGTPGSAMRIVAPSGQMLTLSPGAGAVLNIDGDVLFPGSSRSMRFRNDANQAIGDASAGLLQATTNFQVRADLRVFGAITATNGGILATNSLTMAQAAGQFTNGSTFIGTISNIAYVGTMTANVPKFSPLRAGLTLVNSNFAVGSPFTNNYGSPCVVSLTANLTLASIAGISRLEVQGNFGITNTGSFGAFAGGFVGSVPVAVSPTTVPIGGIVNFVDTSTGAGDSAVVKSDSGQISY